MKHPDLRKKLAQVEGLTDEERAYLQGLLSAKKYGLVWEDKPEDAEERLKTELPVLEEVVERRVLSPVQEKTAAAKESNQLTLDLAAPAPNVAVADDDTTSPLSTGAQSDGGEGGRGGEADKAAPNHLLIEGDNLHALTALSFTHAGKVDVIYIDPPYNTGNKDFKYNDTFVDKEDAYRHSKWLSFMHKRLKIAKTLLKETGVIFISIDDNEQAQLKMLCDDIFSQDNFISISIRRRRKTQANLARHIAPVHEYVLIYSKNSLLLKLNKLKYTDDFIKAGFSNPDNDERGLYQTGPLARPKNSKNKEYTLTMPNGKMITAKWSCSEETFRRYIAENRLVIPKGGDGMPRIKIFLSELEGQMPNTWWDDTASNDEAAKEIENIFGTNEAFSFPKPVGLLDKILNLSTLKYSIILDFFAGSGTTLHATMALNAEDGGNRQCILVTNNENTIAEEVCYERNKRVIEGYTKPNGEFVPGLSGNNLRYYRVGFVGSERTLANEEALARAATDLIAIKEDAYEHVDDNEFYTVLKNNNRYVVIVYPAYYQFQANEAAIAAVQALPLLDTVSRDLSLYAYTPTHEIIREDFEPIWERIDRAIPLPMALKNTYKQIRQILGLNQIAFSGEKTQDTIS